MGAKNKKFEIIKKEFHIIDHDEYSYFGENETIVRLPDTGNITCVVTDGAGRYDIHKVIKTRGECPVGQKVRPKMNIHCVIHYQF